MAQIEQGKDTNEILERATIYKQEVTVE